MSFSIRLTDAVDKAIHDAITEPLGAYNAERIGADDYRWLVLVLEDAQGRVVGGLSRATS